MDIFFCDVCCARVTANHLSRGHGVRNADVIICGSCLEKGHGAELLAEAKAAEVGVGAAPRLAGAGVLDEPRDRVSTMKNLEPIDDDNDANEEILDLHDDSALDSDDGDLEQTLLANEEGEGMSADSLPEIVDTPDIDAADDRDGDNESEAQEQSSDQLEVVDLDEVADEDDNAQVDEIAAAAIDLDAEDKRPISADDAVDDLDDSGSYPIQESNRLEDADESQHTDSYSADELAAIKRLAEKEKAKVDSAVVAAPSGKSSGRKKSSSSSRRSTAQSGRNASRKSARKPASKSSSKASSKSSRKTSTRTKAKKEAMPLPMMISFITIPIIIIIFIVIASTINIIMIIGMVIKLIIIPIIIIIFIVIASTSGGDSGRKETKYEMNVTGLNAKVDHVYRDAQGAYQSENLDDLYAAQKKIRDAIAMKNQVADKMEKAGYSDNQMDKSLRKFRKLMQLERAVRDKIEEVKSRQGK